MLKPSSYNSLAELIHALGMRSDTAWHIGISHNTLNVRMAKPGSFTLDELVKVAELAKSDLLTTAEQAADMIKSYKAWKKKNAGRK
jgi:hypothetical protein